MSGPPWGRGSGSEPETRTLVVCAVEAEAEAVAAGIPACRSEPVGRLTGWTSAVTDIVVSGVGPAAAAAAAGIALSHRWYGRAVSMGIAGAFRGAGASIGGIVIGDELIAADLGVLAPEGFQDVESLGFGLALGRLSSPPDLVRAAAGRCTAAGLHTVTGAVLTLSTFTGTDERALALHERHQPTAEAMEGMGVACAAAHFDIPVLEIRSISNWVGNRDREAWELPAALSALRQASAAVLGAGWLR